MAPNPNPIILNMNKTPTLTCPIRRNTIALTLDHTVTETVGNISAGSVDTTS